MKHGTIDTDLAPIEGRLAAADEAANKYCNFASEPGMRWELESEGTIPEEFIDLWIHAQETERTLLDELQRTREERATWRYEASCEHDHAVAFMEELEWVTKERGDLRNELCLMCGKYHDAHNGACDGCRWRK